jgi:hypothetical protein
MTLGPHGERTSRRQAYCGPSLGLGLVLAGAGASGIAAVLTLLSGGGLLTAFLVYVVGGSLAVPTFAVAPYVVAVARTRRAGPRLSRQPS